MATGLKITLPVAFTDTSLPSVPDDLMLTAGSLLLVDHGHSLNATQNPSAGNGWASGVPTDGTSLPNLAYAQANALIAGSTQSTVAPTMARSPNSTTNFGTTANDLAGVYGLLERTGKGALHGITSPTHGDAATGKFSATIKFPATILTYVKTTNPTHRYYVSLWARKTRAAVGRVNFRYLSELAADVSNYAYLIREDGATGSVVGASQTGASVPGTVSDTSGTAFIENGDFSGITGTIGTDRSRLAMWDTAWTGNGSGYINGQFPSWIFYRFYLEDLTVSGRTYAQVAALDTQAFGFAFGVGGRYNGDSFTSPSTVG